MLMSSQSPLARTGVPEDNFPVLLWEGCSPNVLIAPLVPHIDRGEGGPELPTVLLGCEKLLTASA